MESQIINRVAESSLITLDLADFFPQQECKTFDIKDFLFRGLVLREKEFREGLKNFDWEKFKNSNVAIVCSADAVVPMWAYMLVVAHLQPVANQIFFGTEAEMKKNIMLQNIAAMDVSVYEGKAIVVKGCGEEKIETDSYIAITKQLLPVVKSLMYGEACSAVPIFKRKTDA